MKKILTTIVTSLLTLGSTQASAGYELWAADQSNSNGTYGSTMYIWDDAAIQQFRTDDIQPAAIDCDWDVWPNGTAATPAPCDINMVFPGTLTAADGSGTLASLGEVSRMHHIEADHMGQYFSVSFYVNGKGFVGVMDGRTKEAIALFRVTETSQGRSVRSAHWSYDDTQLLIANKHGHLLERINITRDLFSKKITHLEFDRAASLGLGGQEQIITSATFFNGTNGTGLRDIGSAVVNPVTSSVSPVSAMTLANGYTSEATSLTYADGTTSLPVNRFCKEDNCGNSEGTANQIVGRPKGEVNCIIPTTNRKAMITLSNGGMFVVDATSTPMTIVSGYSNTIVNGAGGCGVEIGGNVFVSMGINEGGLGAFRSTFGQYKFNPAAYGTGVINSNVGGVITLGDSPGIEGKPLAAAIAHPGFNTQGLGNTTGLGGLLEFASGGTVTETFTGQDPNTSTRRDTGGSSSAFYGSHLHVTDRIKNTITAINTNTSSFYEYSIRSDAGTGCSVNSVGEVPGNDPTPAALIEGPDGTHLLFAALHGPVPKTAIRASQGSCPGVGIIEIKADGSIGSGRDGSSGSAITNVLRATNTNDTSPAHIYGETTPGSGILAGANIVSETERADVHSIAIRKCD